MEACEMSTTPQAHAAGDSKEQEERCEKAHGSRVGIPPLHLTSTSNDFVGLTGSAVVPPGLFQEAAQPKGGSNPCENNPKEEATAEVPSFVLEWDLASEEEEYPVEECSRIFNEASVSSKTSGTANQPQERLHTKRAAESTQESTTEDEAFQKALSKESHPYERSSGKIVYIDMAVNTLKQLRRESAQHGGASSAGSVSPCAGTSAPAAAPAQPTNRMISHKMVLQGTRAARISCSIEENRYRKPPPERMEERFYKLLEVYRMTPEQLVEYNYPRPHPVEPGRALFAGTDRRQYSKLNGSVLQCSRCGATFALTEDGDYVRPDECVHHWGRLWKKWIAGALESRYSCCEGDGESRGCCVAKGHVHEGPEPSQLTGFVSTLAKRQPPGGGCPGVYALDCEMCYTSQGVELARVTVVDWHLRPVYEKLVKPRGQILDYATRFSGLKDEDTLRRF
ncbi:hypothetical protein MRX96_015050 [Rhipicephalus microplus]